MNEQRARNCLQGRAQHRKEAALRIQTPSAAVRIQGGVLSIKSIDQEGRGGAQDLSQLWWKNISTKKTVSFSCNSVIYFQLTKVSYQLWATNYTRPWHPALTVTIPAFMEPTVYRGARHKKPLKCSKCWDERQHSIFKE